MLKTSIYRRNGPSIMLRRSRRSLQSSAFWAAEEESTGLTLLGDTALYTALYTVSFTTWNITMEHVSPRGSEVLCANVTCEIQLPIIIDSCILEIMMSQGIITFGGHPARRLAAFGS